MCCWQWAQLLYNFSPLNIFFFFSIIVGLLQWYPYCFISLLTIWPFEHSMWSNPVILQALPNQLIGNAGNKDTGSTPTSWFCHRTETVGTTNRSLAQLSVCGGVKGCLSLLIPDQAWQQIYAGLNAIVVFNKTGLIIISILNNDSG